jgi:omega-6 fatty acid desaturase (delta-12 desaturase)
MPRPGNTNQNSPDPRPEWRLQWFTGNIGFHHVHHADPRIPNYRLEECHYADAGFQLASTLTLRTALLALRYALWDSDLERLVPFRLAADS